MRSQKDTEANILWILDMHYVMFKYSGTCWITLIRTPLWRKGSHQGGYKKRAAHSEHFLGGLICTGYLAFRLQ